MKFTNCFRSLSFFARQMRWCLGVCFDVQMFDNEGGLLFFFFFFSDGVEKFRTIELG